MRKFLLVLLAAWFAAGEAPRALEAKEKAWAVAARRPPVCAGVSGKGNV